MGLSRSLRYRLPASIATLLAVAVGTFGAISYTAVRRSDLESARGRLRVVTDRLAQAARIGTAARVRRMSDAAKEPAIISALELGASTDSARGILAQLGPDTGATVAILLQDRDGQTIVFNDHDVKPLLAERRDTVSVSPIITRNDSLLFEFSVPVHRGGKLLGHVVQLREVRTGPATLQTLSELVGTEAKVMIGNKDGTVWSDFDSLVTPPPDLGKETRYLHAGRERLLATEPILGTPLIIGVEFPVDRVFARSRSLLWVFAAIGAAVVLLGIVLAWVISNRITGPLSKLTAAAESISAGGLEVHHRELARDDEIGRLDDAFRTMAQNVREARENLEQQVAARTSALESAQDALVRKERMAVLGQLASSVGHELRNPLGVISNVVYYLQATAGESSQPIRERLTVVSNQVKLAEKIISDILDFTRVKSPDLHEVTVSEIVSDQIGRVALPQGIDIHTDLEEELPSALVDPVQVGLVLFNLLTNAVQAMEGKGGILTVRTRADGGRIRIEVEDDGPGVPTDYLDRIFEPLFTTKSRGFGLGLSISRSLITANGGLLTVSNVPGRGAIFVVDLPAAEVVA